MNLCSRSIGEIVFDAFVVVVCGLDECFSDSSALAVVIHHDVESKKAASPIFADSSCDSSDNVISFSFDEQDRFLTPVDLLASEQLGSFQFHALPLSRMERG